MDNTIKFQCQFEMDPQSPNLISSIFLNNCLLWTSNHWDFLLSQLWSLVGCGMCRRLFVWPLPPPLLPCNTSLYVLPFSLSHSQSWAPHYNFNSAVYYSQDFYSSVSENWLSIWLMLIYLTFENLLLFWCLLFSLYKLVSLISYILKGSQTSNCFLYFFDTDDEYCTFFMSNIETASIYFVVLWSNEYTS